MSKTTSCLACHHTENHDRSEYEDTHLRCLHSTVTKHKGIDCGHARYRAGCDDCWIEEIWCECSNEDRKIASLKAKLAAIVERVKQFYSEGEWELGFDLEIERLAKVEE